MSHLGEKGHKLTGIFTLSDLEEVGDGLESCKINVERSVVKGLRENGHQIRLEFDQVVHNVREESIKDLKSSINLNLLLLIHEGEEKIEQVLPDEVLLLINGTANFNKQIAHLVNDCLIVAIADCLKKLVLDEDAGIRAKSLPQVLVVRLVANILGVDSS